MNTTHEVQNSYISGSMVLMILGAMAAAIAPFYYRIRDAIFRMFIITVSTNQHEECYWWLESWLNEKKMFSSSHMLNWERDYSKDKGNEVVSYLRLVPSLGDHYFHYNGEIVWLSKSEHTRGQGNTSYVTVSITLRARAGSKVLDQIMEEARLREIEEKTKKVTIFVPEDGKWLTACKKEKRSLDTLATDDHVKEELITDMQQFLDSREWYYEKGLPYRRGYLLYGEPGCGKSSIISALAGEFCLNICCLNLTDPNMNDNTLMKLMRRLPSRAIVLLEDIDCLFVDRKSKEETSKGVSFSAVLNAIDGVVAGEGRFLFMTTNHKEKLSRALIRPGRCDRQFELKLSSPIQLAQMYHRFFPDGPPSAAKKFGQSVPPQTVSPATVQGHLLIHRHDARGALERAADMMRQTEEDKKEREESAKRKEEEIAEREKRREERRKAVAAE
ncbi:hypothetical protein PROFUN_06831 [Planoprotostelium fungivorum]|uniref:Mitochondrial chaperone BCS1 n=1 Tax=Planoprotostelium fungivorum TaxID=1890364 RepID=A0A2P6NNF0_9EUKA|nr:hypothetical protein PROFUN_06831 [Planoprotostelium fungivorum]